jgi:hypothetical protein
MKERNVMLLLTIEKNEERKRKFVIVNWERMKEICDCELGKNEQKLNEATRKKEASRS